MDSPPTTAGNDGKGLSHVPDVYIVTSADRRASFRSGPSRWVAKNVVRVFNDFSNRLTSSRHPLRVLAWIHGFPASGRRKMTVSQKCAQNSWVFLEDQLHSGKDMVPEILEWPVFDRILLWTPLKNAARCWAEKHRASLSLGGSPIWRSPKKVWLERSSGAIRKPRRAPCPMPNALSNLKILCAPRKPPKWSSCRNPVLATAVIFLRPKI